MKKPIRTISIIAGVVLVLVGACELARKPSPEDFVTPKITEDITGVVFPALEIDEILSVEGPESFDFLGKTYYWVRVDYCDTTRLDTFFASIDSVIANGDTRWQKNASGNYYDAACLYARMGDTKRSLKMLETALCKGYRRFEHMGKDDDLKNIRSTKEYKMLIEKYRK